MCFLSGLFDTEAQHVQEHAECILHSFIVLQAYYDCYHLIHSQHWHCCAQRSVAAVDSAAFVALCLTFTIHSTPWA